MDIKLLEEARKIEADLRKIIAQLEEISLDKNIKYINPNIESDFNALVEMYKSGLIIIKSKLENNLQEITKLISSIEKEYKKN